MISNNATKIEMKCVRGDLLTPIFLGNWKENTGNMQLKYLKDSFIWF